jgi:hypothetical protein
MVIDCAANILVRELIIAARQVPAAALAFSAVFCDPVFSSLSFGDGKYQ